MFEYKLVKVPFVNAQTNQAVSNPLHVIKNKIEQTIDTKKG